MSKPVKDHTSSKVLTVVTVLIGVLCFIRPWEVDVGLFYVFAVWSVACWIYTEDTHRKDLRIYNLTEFKYEERLSVAERIGIEENKNCITIGDVDSQNDLEVYNTFMSPSEVDSPYGQVSPQVENYICQCCLGQPYANINCEHKVAGGNLERKGIIVAKKCFVHDSWRNYDGAYDLEVVEKEYAKERLLQLDKDISTSLDAKFKEKGIK